MLHPQTQKATGLVEVPALNSPPRRKSITRSRRHLNLPYNAPPVDVASGSCPEVGLWDITLLAKPYCSTCPRSRFLGSFTDHFDGLPTIRPSAPGSLANWRLLRQKNGAATWITPLRGALRVLVFEKLGFHSDQQASRIAIVSGRRHQIAVEVTVYGRPSRSKSRPP